MSYQCVPLYDTLGENAVEYIINHSEVGADRAWPGFRVHRVVGCDVSRKETRAVANCLLAPWLCWRVLFLAPKRTRLVLWRAVLWRAVQAVLAFADARKLGSLAKALKGVDISRFTTLVYWGKEDAAAVKVGRQAWGAVCARQDRSRGARSCVMGGCCGRSSPALEVSSHLD